MRPRPHRQMPVTNPVGIKEIAFALGTESLTPARARCFAAGDLCGVYVGTANSLPVLQAIEKSGRANSVAVVTTGLFPALTPLIRSGRILATVDQRPQAQGCLALQGAVPISDGRQAPGAGRQVAPHIVKPELTLWGR